MAVFHLAAQIIGRSRGRSVVAAAAYRSGGRLAEAGSGITFDFTRKAGVIHTAVLLPAGAPDRLGDRERLWNEVEAVERRKDAQLTREIEFALPAELSDADAIELARAYVQEQFVVRGMIADLAVHKPVGRDGSGRPHAHVLLSLRAVGEAGFGAKERAWNSAVLLHDWREALAVRTNQALAEREHSARVDHRSYAERGIALEPQSKVGPGRSGAGQGRAAQRTAAHRALAARNGERLAAEPGLALELLTEHSASFTRHELARLVATHSDGAAQFTRVMARIEASPELVRLGVDGRGEERFTSRSMQAAEQGLRQDLVRLGRQHRPAAGTAERARVIGAAGLSAEQGRAVEHVTGAGGLSLVVGYAGTGKSLMLGTARQAWEAAGCRVRGAALSGIAAEGLEAGSGIESRTLASLEHAWARGRERLQAGDVLVIDEAGMVGTRQMARVTRHAAEAGAKVVLVGDPQQLQSIQAGGWFRDAVARHGSAVLAEVRRQREPWQRAATLELATARTGAALSRYEAAGMLRAAPTQEAACAALIRAWAHDRQAVPERSQIILAATRADVQALNALARERLQRAGGLGGEQTVMTERGPRQLAVGERLLFLRNERSMGVKNGTLGTLERVEGQQLTVRLDGAGQRRVTFHSRDYAALEHGYATTVHKAQGSTVDYSYLLLTGHMDRHGTYVALSRHRQGVVAFYAGDRFASLARLAERLGRNGSKEQSLAVGEGERQGGAGGLRQQLGRVRAALARVGAMASGRTRAQASPEQTGAGAGGGSRLEQQVARAREAAEQLRQQRAGQRDAAMPQDGGAGARQPGAGGGTRLEQQAARARDAAAQLRQPRATRQEAAGQRPARQGEPGAKPARLTQQVLIARRVAARLRQRAREHGDGLER